MLIPHQSRTAKRQVLWGNTSSNGAPGRFEQLIKRNLIGYKHSGNPRGLLNRKNAVLLLVCNNVVNQLI